MFRNQFWRKMEHGTCSTATRYLHTELKAQEDPVIQRKSYFDHPENLLIAMLTDSEPHIRELEVHLILKARSIQEMGSDTHTIAHKKPNRI
ncbi:hypothetical protein AVEN_74740-1 [Araneus ventricosus]|uniref:Uncharacterized protein n=1 Tax=Araneus ventricosus TaxID=182803 RepID=A0A4Y2TRP9_ARAVE|nr:hypothetical protein AVEN_74740-1 [Araneus ventricosus]